MCNGIEPHSCMMLQIENCSQPNITKAKQISLANCVLSLSRLRRTHSDGDINLVKHIPMCKWRSRAIVRVPNSTSTEKNCNTTAEDNLKPIWNATTAKIWTEEIKAMILNQREKLSGRNVRTPKRDNSHSK